MNARFAALLVVAIVATGCTRTSQYALESPFAGVYTKSAKRASSTPVFPTGLNRAARDPSRKYFVQFRARNAESYGHLALAFGKLDARGRVPMLKNGNLRPGNVEISGLAPASDSKAVYSAGHLVPVLATTGPSDGDHEEDYALATWTLHLSKSEFDKTVAIIRDRMKRDRYWNGLANSCVTYGRNIATAMGLKTPSRPHLPEGFVSALKRINES